jgi:hypothetical protein
MFPTPVRTVVVVGPELTPESRMDMESIAGAVAARRGELVVLSVGWPPTPAQRGVVDGAMRAAAERRLACSAHLVWSADEVEDHLQTGDTVVRSPGALPAPEASAVPTFA